MNFSIRSKKILASLMAMTIVSGAAASNASMISSIIPSVTISASAAVSGNWEYTVQSNVACITKYTGSAQTVTVPSTIGGYTVRKLGAAFKNKTGVKTVTLPSTLTEIGKDAFYKAFNLTSVTIPNSVTKIDESAFEGTSKLTGLTLPSTLTTIGFSAFAESGLYTVTIPSKVTSIGEWAFAACPNLNTATFNNSNKMQTLSFAAFNECPNLKNVFLPAGLKTIDSYAFKETGLKQIDIPSSVTMIKSDCFNNCTKLTTVNIQGTANLEIGVFSNCSVLNNLTMNTTTFTNAIKKAAFAGCPTNFKVNNKQILFHYSSGEPYFNPSYKSIIEQNYGYITGYNVGFFDEYIDYQINKVAVSVTANCHTTAQKVRALHDWICNKVSYAPVDPKPGHDYHHKECVFMDVHAVCAGYADAFKALCDKAGVTSYYVSSYDHAWNIVKLGNRYFHVDVCHDDGNPVNYSHYLKSDNDIKKCNTGHGSWTLLGSPAPSCPYSVGDVNMDGKITVADADRICSYIAHLATIPDTTLADVNGNGVVDISDSVAIHVMIGQ